MFEPRSQLVLFPFPDSKFFIESVGDSFTLRFLPDRNQSGFFPLAVEHKEDDKVTSYTRDIIFPIKYHTLSLAETNPAYPNKKNHIALLFLLHMILPLWIMIS
jgi:hypothetical protein